jgi:hypothetical protein
MEINKCKILSILIAVIWRYRTYRIIILFAYRVSYKHQYVCTAKFKSHRIIRLIDLLLLSIEFFPNLIAYLSSEIVEYYPMHVIHDTYYMASWLIVLIIAIAGLVRGKKTYSFNYSPHRVEQLNN